MNNYTTPNSKITGKPLAPLPAKTRLYTRRPKLNLAAITERNLIFNQMLGDADNEPDAFSTPVKSQQSNMCPNAPRKNPVDTSDYDFGPDLVKKLAFE